MLQDPVVLEAGAEDDAFAGMMATLIRQNLTDQPRKRRDLARMRGRVALVAEDIGLSVTLRFAAGLLHVHSGLYGVPDLVIRGPSEALIDLSRIPHDARLPFLPDLRSPVARSLARCIAERKLRVRGLLAHAELALRVSRLMSIY